MRKLTMYLCVNYVIKIVFLGDSEWVFLSRAVPTKRDCRQRWRRSVAAQSSTTATSHTRLLSARNAISGIEELIFKCNPILIN